MRPPFPGMDPWLEDPELWPNVHNSLVAAIRDDLGPLLRPRYFVDLESRTTVLTGRDEDRLYSPDLAIFAGNVDATPSETGVAVIESVATKPYRVMVKIPDFEIEETFLTIRELPGRRVVTVLEILSPTNKRTEDARKDYLEKRRNLIVAGANFVEIDLLRAGKPMPPDERRHRSDYRILIFRPRLGRIAELYGFSYRTEIPPIPVPLLPQDAEPALDLNRILHNLYDRAGYDLAIDYRQPPRPRLRNEDQAWAESIIAQAAPRSPDAPAGGEPPP